MKTWEWSDLVISRNYLMSYFLAQKQFTHALLLDSDMSYPADLFFDLLAFDADFTCAPYPQRQMRWQAFRSLIEAEAAKPEAERASTADLLARSLRYNVAEVFDAGQPWPVEIRGNFRKAPGVGTGFMLLRRAVPERMVETGAALPVPGFNGPGYPGADFHDFFNAISPNPSPAPKPSHVSFDVVWRGRGDRQPIRDTDFGFVGEYVGSDASISFTASNDSADVTYTSVAADQTSAGAGVGHERNGVFLS